jgi:hypothetical protein
VQGTVALGPNREVLAERERGEADDVGAGEREGGQASEQAAATVLVSGNLGLVYLPLSPQRLTLEQIEAAHPALVRTLAGHPGVGFVMVRSERGPLVIGARGRRRLENDTVDGEDPLAGFPPTAAEHLRRHDRFPHCPDILVNSMYDPDSGEVAPFEEFMGSHGGLGGPQSRPFAVIPAQWREPPQPIVGVEAMHEALREWIAGDGQAAHDRARPTSDSPASSS